MSTIFVSYAREDSEEAYKIASHLRRFKVDVWFDQEKLLAGQNWPQEVRRAIAKSDYVIFLISNSSINKRGFVQREVKQALDILEEFPEYGVFILPVRLEPCEVTNEKLQSLQWVDMFPSFDHGIHKIVNALKAHNSEKQGLTLGENVKDISGVATSIVPNPSFNNSAGPPFELSDIARQLLVRDVLSRRNYLPYLICSFSLVSLLVVVMFVLEKWGVDPTDESYQWYPLFAGVGSLAVMFSFYLGFTGLMRRNQSVRIKRKVLVANSILRWDIENNHYIFYKLTFGNFAWRFISFLISIACWIFSVAGAVVVIAILFDSFLKGTNDQASIIIVLIIGAVLIVPGVTVILWKRRVWRKYEQKAGILPGG